MEGQRRVTLKDVASEAGVSVSTASRALKNRTSINPVTRNRVVAAAETLNYVQVSERTTPGLDRPKNIAIVVSDIRNPYHSSMILGLEDEAGYDNVNLVLMTTREDPLREYQIEKRITTLPFDGMVLLNSCLNGETILSLQTQLELPTVIFSYTIDHSHIGCVIADTEAAAYRAATHLISLGHSRIAFIGVANRAGEERRHGVVRALQDANIQIDPAMLIERNIGDEERGKRAMKDLFALDSPPSAVIAFNDTMAHGIIHEISRHGLRIPKDISIIGIDDIPTSAYLVPPLTTVAMPTYHMGQMAMRLLRRIEAGEDMRTTEPIILECPLVIRESTGPAPKD